MKKQLFEIIEKSDGSNRASAVYDYSMMAVIIASLLPLAFKKTTPVLTAIDYVTVAIFILDYLLRLLTADLKLQKGTASYFLYPFTPMALIDLLCILPTFTALSGGIRLLKIVRLARAFRVFRAAKMLRYSKSIIIVIDVIKEQRRALLAVGTLAVAYILIAALVIFNVEPDSFDTYFDAIYWATVSLTTVGYGDIYPVSTAGRVITMLSSILGIAVVALPSGIITAGYLERIHAENDSPAKEQSNDASTNSDSNDMAAETKTGID